MLQHDWTCQPQGFRGSGDNITLLGRDMIHGASKITYLLRVSECLGVGSLLQYILVDYVKYMLRDEVRYL